MLSSFSFSEKTIGFLIEGKFDEKILDKIHLEIIEKLHIFDKINLYLEDSSIDSFSLSTVVEEITFKIKHANRFHKIALVTDRKWIHLCASFDNLFMDANVKSFSTEDRLDAIAWIASVE